MIDAVRLKTVYDSTRHDSTGHRAGQLKLHVASWKENVSAAAGLTVISVGEPSRSVRDFIEDAGAAIEVSPDRHCLFQRSPIYNKHLAAPTHLVTERVFLTDNDTIFFEDTTALNDFAHDHVGVTLPDNRRVSPRLWQELQVDLAFPVIPLTWIPWKEKALAETEGRAPTSERFAYFNGGAILFPRGRNVWDLWETESYRLSAYLESRGLNDRKDAGSDQLSLTSAVGRHGKWSFLPPGYNIRPFHFWLAGGYSGPIVHMHMVNTGYAARALGGDDSFSLTALLRKYWELFCFEHVRPQRLEQARDLLERAVSISKSFDIDRLTPASPL